MVENVSECPVPAFSVLLNANLQYSNGEHHSSGRGICILFFIFEENTLHEVCYAHSSENQFFVLHIHVVFMP